MDMTSTGLPAPTLFGSKPVRSWLAIGFICVYIALCWVVYCISVEPQYDFWKEYTIEADSSAYFDAAGIDRPANVDAADARSGLVSFGGSTLGPVILATIFRNRFWIALCDCSLFILAVQLAASVPGLQRRTFAVLLAMNALTVPALITLNKEVLALVGLAFFAKYLYSKNRPLWLLGVACVFSLMARWQQVAFIVVFLCLQAQWSPFRSRPKLGIAALLLFVSAAWAVVSAHFENLIAAYLALQSEINTGTITRLNAIQSRGGFFVVVWPKIVMNVSGRIVQFNYFLTQWIHSDFHDLQNTLIGNLHSLALVVLLVVMVIKGRFRLARPLVHFTLVYFILTSVSPLIQNRYEYPAYAVLAMEMSRRKESLEPVKPFRKLPPLPPSYVAPYLEKYPGGAKVW